MIVTVPVLTLPTIPAVAFDEPLFFVEVTVPAKEQLSIVALVCVLPTMPPTKALLLAETLPSTFRFLMVAPQTVPNRPAPVLEVKFTDRPLMVWFAPSKVPAYAPPTVGPSNGVHASPPRSMSAVSVAQSLLDASALAMSRNALRSAAVASRYGSSSVPLPLSVSAASAAGMRPTSSVSTSSRARNRFFMCFPPE